MKQPIALAIIDDHEVVRKGLRAVLTQEVDFCIVGEGSTGAEAIQLVQRCKPQMVLLDFRLPDSSATLVCRQILDQAPMTRILILSSYDDESTIIQTVQSGAHGYALKDIRTSDLIQSIRTVAAGHGYLDPRVCSDALGWMRSRQKQGDTGLANDLFPLSRQERLIMPLLAQGQTNKEIAVHMSLSDKTIKNYLANIFQKLGVRSRSQAVAWYLRSARCEGRGLTSMP